MTARSADLLANFSSDLLALISDSTVSKTRRLAARGFNDSRFEAVL